MDKETIKYLNDNFSINKNVNFDNGNDLLNKCLRFFNININNFNSKTLRSRYFEKCKLYHPDTAKNSSNPLFNDSLFKITYDINKYLSDVLFDKEADDADDEKGKSNSNKKRLNLFELILKSPKGMKYSEQQPSVPKPKSNPKPDIVELSDDDNDDQDDDDDDINYLGNIQYALKDLDKHSIQTFLNENRISEDFKNDPLINSICTQKYNNPIRRVRYNPTISLKKEVDVSILYSSSPDIQKRTFEINVTRQDINPNDGNMKTFNQFTMNVIFPIHIRVNPPYFLILKQRGHQNIHSGLESTFESLQSPSSETIDLSKLTILSYNLFVVDPPPCPHLSRNCNNCIRRHDIFVVILPKLPPFYKYNLTTRTLTCEIITKFDSVNITDILDPTIQHSISKSCILKNKGLLSILNPLKRLDLKVTFTKTNDLEKVSSSDIIKNIFS